MATSPSASAPEAIMSEAELMAEFDTGLAQIKHYLSLLKPIDTSAGDGGESNSGGVSFFGDSSDEEDEADGKKPDDEVNKGKDPAIDAEALMAESRKQFEAGMAELASTLLPKVAKEYKTQVETELYEDGAIQKPPVPVSFEPPPVVVTPEVLEEMKAKRRAERKAAKIEAAIAAGGDGASIGSSHSGNSHDSKTLFPSFAEHIDGPEGEKEFVPRNLREMVSHILALGLFHGGAPWIDGAIAAGLPFLFVHDICISGSDRALSQLVMALSGVLSDHTVGPMYRCWTCNNMLIDATRCKNCKWGRWCGPTCQTAGWNPHRKPCERAKKGKDPKQQQLNFFQQNINQKLISRLFDILDQVHGKDDDLGLSVVLLILRVNALFLDDATSLTLAEIKNRPEAAATFGEIFLLYFNKVPDPATEHLCIKMLINLLASPETSSFFYTNDIIIIHDVLVRGIADKDEQDITRDSYLRALKWLLGHAATDGLKSRFPELRTLLKDLISDRSEIRGSAKTEISAIFREFPGILEAEE